MKDVNSPNLSDKYSTKKRIKVTDKSWSLFLVPEINPDSVFKTCQLIKTKLFLKTINTAPFSLKNHTSVKAVIIFLSLPPDFLEKRI